MSQATDAMQGADLVAQLRAGGEAAVSWRRAVRAVVVPRPALWARLERSARVTVVSAPPGSGKTVLLRSWIGDARFYTDPRPDTGRQDRIAVGPVLRGESFHAGHRDDACGVPCDCSRSRASSGVKAAVDRGAATGTRKLTGVWPGEEGKQAGKAANHG